MPLWQPAVIGGPLPGATAGSVLFAGTAGVFAQDNAHLFWDDTNDALKVGGDPPASATLAKLGLGSAISGGSAGGTGFGANFSSGFAGDLAAWQVNGVTKFSVNALGYPLIGAGAFAPRIIFGAPTSAYASFASVGPQMQCFLSDFSALADFTAANVVASGFITAIGPAAKVSIARRDTNALAWSFYSTSGDLQILDEIGTGDRLTLTSLTSVLTHTVMDAATTTVTATHLLGHHSSGTPGTGFGSELRFRLQSSTTPDRDAAGISALWATATDATRKADLVLSVFDTAVREAIRFSTNGTVAYSFLTGDPPASATLSKLGLGSAIASGSAAGTYLGLNAAGGFAGNFVDLQLGGTSRYQVDYRGHQLIAAGAVASYSSDFISEWRDGPAGNTRAMVNFDSGITAFTQQVGNIVNRTRLLTDASAFYVSTGNDLQFQCGTFSGASVISFVTGLGSSGPNLALNTTAFLVDAVTRTRTLDAVTATTSIVQYFDHNSSGTPANGFGGEIRLRLKSSTTDARQVASLFWSWVDATDASRKGRVVGTVWDTAEREWIRGEADGALPFVSLCGGGGKVGIGTTSPDTLLHLYASSPTIKMYHTGTSRYGKIVWDANGFEFGSNTADAQVSIHPDAPSSSFGVIQDGAFYAKCVETATNYTFVCADFRAQSTATPANAFGGTLRFRLESSTLVDETAATMEWLWVDATDASRKTRVRWCAYDTAEREAMRFEASGSAPRIGFLGAAAIAVQTISGSRGGNAALANLLTAFASFGLIVDSTSA